MAPDPIELVLRWEGETLNRKTSHPWEVAGSFRKAQEGTKEREWTLCSEIAGETGEAAS